MGEFKTPFNSIVTKNIKHIYSGFPQVINMRHSNPYPSMEQLRLREDNHELKSDVLRFSEYAEEYGCYIPRAPAFRSISSSDMDEIVKRLQRPTVASKGISNTSEKSVLDELDKKNPKFRGGRRVDEAEIPGITERLMKPTIISTIRKQQREANMPNNDLPEVSV